MLLVLAVLVLRRPTAPSASTDLSRRKTHPPGMQPCVARSSSVIVCRMSQYAGHTSLWHDEAYVALNVVQKTYGGLARTVALARGRAARVPLRLKDGGRGLGRSEYALRLAPAVAGLAGLVALRHWRDATCTSAAAACWAVVLMAASDKLIVRPTRRSSSHSTSCAPCCSPTRAARLAPAEHDCRAARLGCLGAFGMWLSFASCFVFGGTSLVLGCASCVRAVARANSVRRREPPMALGTFGLLLVSFRDRSAADC